MGVQYTPDPITPYDPITYSWGQPGDATDVLFPDAVDVYVLDPALTVTDDAGMVVRGWNPTPLHTALPCSFQSNREAPADVNDRDGAMRNDTLFFRTDPGTKRGDLYVRNGQFYKVEATYSVRDTYWQSEVMLTDSPEGF